MTNKLEDFSLENCPCRQIRLNPLDDGYQCMLDTTPSYEPACNFDGKDYRECPMITFDLEHTRKFMSGEIDR